MLSSSLRLLAFGSVLTSATAHVLPHSSYISFSKPSVVEAGGVHNIEISYDGPVNGELSIHYGSCGITLPAHAHHKVGRTHVGSHPSAKRHVDWDDNRPTKFVWIAPADITDGGCLHAFVGEELVGRSNKLGVTKRKTRRGAAFADVADWEGPWFDGVVALQQKEPDDVFVASTKAKSFGILGGGMSGLMTAFLLESVGITNWKILEASGRIGGRVHTSYLNGTKPEDYQYQEMGPMRFPRSIKYADTNETLEIQDMKMVFQLADTLNAFNKDPALEVKFINWIQSSANTPASTSKRRPDGTVPGRTEVNSMPAYRDNTTATYSNATAVAEAMEEFEEWYGLDREATRQIATNMFEAHKQAIHDGKFDFSEAAYLRYVLEKDWNITDQISSISGFDPSWAYEDVYFAATSWYTIDKGLSNLPRAFTPLVQNRTMYQIKVQEMAWNNETNKMSVRWRPGNPFDMQTKSIEFDYTVVSVPFSKVRLWRLPAFSSLLGRAIGRLNYDNSCKVALHYKTRFWEHLERPIIGGCGSTNIPGISSVCYPSYNINGTGPGVILASYASGVIARSLQAMPEIEHVAHVQRAMIEIHGKVAEEQFTGAYDRICWANDQYQAGPWASPTVGQQQLYIPAYYRTEMNTVFIGEHTSFTHAWIFSALESAVRGTAQLLLDMGLVDEAKQITNEWMARWISV